MMPSRQLPLPGSPEARDQGCTCPDPANAAANAPSGPRPGEVAIDDDCPVHGLAASARDRAGEPGQIDTEGDIVERRASPNCGAADAKKKAGLRRPRLERIPLRATRKNRNAR
jgi:hypothetical protein